MSESCTCSCATPRRRRRPTATLVIACLALFMSLGGTSYAAVKAKSIGSKQLKSNSVTSAKIARNAVTASDIRAGVIDGTKVRAGSIASQHILDGSVTGQDIAPNSIGSQHILDGSVGAQDIQEGSIGAREIAANSINSAQIADQSLGLGEFNQALVDLFRDVPTTWVVDGTRQPTPSEPDPAHPIVSTTDFTTMRSYTAPAVGTGKTGRNLIQSQVSLSATSASEATCWISLAADSKPSTPAVVKATVTTTVTGRIVVPVTALVALSEGNVVQSRCRATGAGTVSADITNDTGATSMTLMRVRD